MSFYEIVKIVFGILASIGGGAGLVAFLSKYFGDIWAKKYLETHKNKLKEQFENEKRMIELEYEKAKNKYLQYSNKQFELYDNLWKQLIDLKYSADFLWDDPNSENLKKFVQSLRKTKREVEKSTLFLEETHYSNLMRLLNEFGEFEIGNKKLIDESQNDNLFQKAIMELTYKSLNESYKEQYDTLLQEIGNSFKSQLRNTIS